MLTRPFIITVTGSRDFNSPDLVNQVFDAICDEWRIGNYPVLVRHGGARGADQLAGKIAKNRGWQVQEFPANWDAHGKSAGYVRNRELIDAEPIADVVAAFQVNNSKGTQNTIDLAHKAFIPVFTPQGEQAPDGTYF